MGKRNVFKQLLKTYAFILLVAITVFAVLISYSMIHQERKKAKIALAQSAGHVADIIREKNSKLDLLIRDLVSNQDKIDNLQAFFEKNESDYLKYSIYQQRDNNGSGFIYLPQQLREIYYDDDTITAIGISLNNEKKVLYSSLDNKNGQFLQRLPVEKEGVRIQKVLINPNTLEQMGTLYLTLRAKEFKQTLVTYGANLPVSLFVTTEQNNLVYDYRMNAADSSLAVLKQGLKNNSLASLSENHYFMQSVTASNGYKIVTVVAGKQVWIALLGPLSILWVGVVLLDLLLITALYKMFSKYDAQVKSILRSMEDVSSGKLEARIEEADKQGELYAISNGINQMLDNINQYMDDIYRLELAQRDAHMRALQSQINPHFLYNTLEYIRMYAVSLEADDLADVVYAFATLLRNNISQEKTTTIAAELEFCEKYFYLYQMRYPDRLAYSFSVAEEVKEVVIPKFIIQPLLENYFLHGIDYSRIDNAGSLKAFSENGEIVISVADNGLGMTVTEIETLNMELKQKNSLEGAESIGIRNVNERLRVYFDNQYSFTFQQNESGGVTAQIRFPLRRADQKERI